MFVDLEKIEEQYRMTDFPLNVAVEPTTFCNLNCIMCDNDSISRNKGNMDIHLYKKTIDEVAAYNKNARREVVCTKT